MIEWTEINRMRAYDGRPVRELLGSCGHDFIFRPDSKPNPLHKGSTIIAPCSTCREASVPVERPGFFTRRNQNPCSAFAPSRLTTARTFNGP